MNALHEITLDDFKACAERLEKQYQEAGGRDTVLTSIKGVAFYAARWTNRWPNKFGGWEALWDFCPRTKFASIKLDTVEELKK